MLTTDVGEIAFALIFELELDSLLLHNLHIIIPCMLSLYVYLMLLMLPLSYNYKNARHDSSFLDRHVSSVC